MKDPAYPVNVGDHDQFNDPVFDQLVRVQTLKAENDPILVNKLCLDAFLFKA